VCAAAAAAVEPRLAAQISSIANWRKDYIPAFRRLTEISALAPDAALQVSDAGLQALWGSMVFRTPEEEMPLSAVRPSPEPVLRTALVTGERAVEPELVVPYRGQRLKGDSLLKQLDSWVREGVVEPGFREAVAQVVRQPEWLDTSDLTIVLLGAGSEMGPALSLLRWGGRVLAIDLPRPAIWERLIQSTRDSAGSLEVPLPVDAPAALDDERLAQTAGVDLVREVPAVMDLLSSVTGSMVLGNYMYADGGMHVRTSLAADVLAMHLSGRPDLTLAFLATPTDAFATPWRDVQASRERWHHRRTSLLQPPLHLFGAFKRNYQNTVVATDTMRYGIADCLVPQQGPNYALAKRMQRWRALAARNAGTPVSLNLAPATRTRSVVKNRALAAAYAGAYRFGIEVFDPSTANSLMAALLVHDLRNPKSPAQPEVPLANPMQLFSAQANHGGLWTTAYEPRSVLGFAAALGMFESRA